MSDGTSNEKIDARAHARARRQGPMGLVVAGVVAFVIVGGGVGMWVAGRGIKARKGELSQPTTARQGGRPLCWILSEPKGADVFVGEQRVGKTPAELDVAGMRVRLEMEGKKSFQGEARCGELVFLAARPVTPAPVPR